MNSACALIEAPDHMCFYKTRARELVAFDRSEHGIAFQYSVTALLLSLLLSFSMFKLCTYFHSCSSTKYRGNTCNTHIF